MATNGNGTITPARHPTAGTAMNVSSSGIEIVGTLSQKNLTPPDLLSEIKSRPKGDRNVVQLGTIFGRVRGLSLRSNIYSDEPSKAFVGIFEAVRSNGGPRIRSSACFLPRTLNDTLAAAVQGEHKIPVDLTPKRGQKFDVYGLNEIVFAIEIGVMHDDSEVGFRYVTKMHGEDSFLHSDPFAELRPLIPGTELTGEISQAPGGSVSTRARIGVPTIPGPAQTSTSDAGMTVADTQKRLAPARASAKAKRGRK
jgi:hypothetical protein